MASSKVVTTNPDLPRHSSSMCSLSTLIADLHRNRSAMDELLNSIYSSPSDPNPNPKDVDTNTVDEVWKEIVSGTESQTHGREGEPSESEEMTLEDFLTKAGAAVTDDHLTGVPYLLPGINAAAMEGSVFSNGIEGTVVGVAPAPAPAPAAGGGRGGRGKRRVAEEPLDKATLQKQRRMIKNRESAARSRERKQVYTVELESLVTNLEEENARLLREEADQKKQRFKQLMECLIPVVEKRKPRRKLRRANSVQW